MAAITDEKYVVFTTFTKKGERKASPVWIAATPNLIGFTTSAESWKVKRLTADARCELQPSDSRGRVTEGTNIATGTARLASGDEFQEIKHAIADKYGITTKLIPMVYKVVGFFTRKGGEAANAAIVVTLDA